MQFIRIKRNAYNNIFYYDFDYFFYKYYKINSTILYLNVLEGLCGFLDVEFRNFHKNFNWKQLELQ